MPRNYDYAGTPWLVGIFCTVVAHKDSGLLPHWKRELVFTVTSSFTHTRTSRWG